MSKNTMYGLLACTVIVLGVGAYWIMSQDTRDEWSASFKTQSVSSFNCNTANTGIPIYECEALVALYNATDWDNWYDNSNWLDPNKQVKTWARVEVQNGTVTILEFANNRLSWIIPPELGQLKNLKSLWLGGNKLTGSIPHELSYLKNLEILGFIDNQLSWPIPVELGQLKNLKSLNLAINQLSWPIPPELGQLRNLESLWLQFNQLSWPIPPELGQLVNLKDLALHINKLSGIIPAELGQLSNLEELQLIAKQLSWPVPPELSQLKKLHTLQLQSNQLSWPIPAELSQLSNLKSLHLDWNQLSWPIPPELGQLRNLESLWLQFNQLSWPIPPELGQLSNINSLYLYKNQLCWILPENFMIHGSWTQETQQISYLWTQHNYLIDDEASYSPEMREWMKSKWFIDKSTNKISYQTPTNCTDMDEKSGQIGDSCGGKAGGCEIGTCQNYKSQICKNISGQNDIDCNSIVDQKICNNNSSCEREDEKLWICTEPFCGDNKVNQDIEQCDGASVDSCPISWSTCSPKCHCTPPKSEPICGNWILEEWEQCDGKGQAQCGSWATCVTTGKTPCTCQYSEVVVPDKLPDTTTGDGDGKPWIKEDSSVNVAPDRDLTR